MLFGGPLLAAAGGPLGALIGWLCDQTASACMHEKVARGCHPELGPMAAQRSLEPEGRYGSTGSRLALDDAPSPPTNLDVSASLGTMPSCPMSAGFLPDHAHSLAENGRSQLSTVPATFLAVTTTRPTSNLSVPDMVRLPSTL